MGVVGRAAPALDTAGPLFPTVPETFFAPFFLLGIFS